MLRVSDRRPPEGHDAVAHVLVDRAAMLIDHLGERSEELVHQQRQRLGIESLGDRGKAAHVGEQRCHLARLPFHVVVVGRFRHLRGHLRWHVLPEAGGDLASSRSFDEKAVGHVEGKQREDHGDPRGERHHQAVVMKYREIGRHHDHEHQHHGNDARDEPQARLEKDQHQAHSENQKQLNARDVCRLVLDALVQNPGDEVGMHLHPGIDALHRRRPQIENPRRGRSNQRDLAFQFRDVDAFVDHVDQRVVFEASVLAAIRDERAPVPVDGNLERPDLELFHQVVDKCRPDRRGSQDEPHHGERQRFVEGPLVLQHHRHAPHDAVGIIGGVEMPAADCRFLKHGEIPGVTNAAYRCRKGVVAQLRHVHRGRRQQALGQHCVVRKQIPHDHVAAFQLPRKEIVEVELRLELAQRRLKRRHALQFPLRKAFQHAHARGFVAFREHHVEADHGDLVLVEQFVHQQREAVARPWPAAFAPEFLLLQAFLVDIQDHHLVVDGAGHGEPEPDIVGKRLERIDQGHPRIFEHVPRKQNKHHHADAGAQEVFFQSLCLRLIRCCMPSQPR